jgi:hypothetical protein
MPPPIRLVPLGLRHCLKPVDHGFSLLKRHVARNAAPLTVDADGNNRPGSEHPGSILHDAVFRLEPSIDRDAGRGGPSVLILTKDSQGWRAVP